MAAETDTRIVVGPNASMSPRLAGLVLMVVASVSGAIAGVSWALGLWPIVPFAGLEVLALAAALAVSLHRNRYREVLEFDGERVRVELGWLGYGAAAEIDWSRSWTRVELLSGATRNAPSELVLRNSSQRLVVARCLSDEEREALHARLKQLLPPKWRPEWSELAPTASHEVTTGG